MILVFSSLKVITADQHLPITYSSDDQVSRLILGSCWNLICSRSFQICWASMKSIPCFFLFAMLFCTSNSNSIYMQKIYHFYPVVNPFTPIYTQEVSSSVQDILISPLLFSRTPSKEIYSGLSMMHKIRGRTLGVFPLRMHNSPRCIYPFKDNTVQLSKNRSP